MNKALVFFLILFSSFTLHKFYVSVTEINYNKNSEQLEISLKVFNDDWQNALDNRLGQPVFLGSKNQYPQLDSLIRTYLFENFSIKINDKKREINIMGSEIEGGATWIYMYVDKVKSLKSIEIKNTLLTEMFEDQRNVVQIKYGDITKSSLFTKSNNSKRFIFE